MNRVQKDGNTETTTYTYEDEKGSEQLAVYKYLENRGWIFIVQSNSSEVYNSIVLVRILMGAVCAVVTVIIILTTSKSKRAFISWSA